MKPVLKKLAALAVLACMAVSAHADIVLKASHQFPEIATWLPTAMMG